MDMESVCTKLGQQDAEELRAEIKSPKVFPPPKPNLMKAQSKAIRELKRDRDCIVLIAGKGIAMDRQDYINKSKPFKPTHLQGNTTGPH